MTNGLDVITERLRQAEKRLEQGDDLRHSMREEQRSFDRDLAVLLSETKDLREDVGKCSTQVAELRGEFATRLATVTRSIWLASGLFATLIAAIIGTVIK